MIYIAEILDGSYVKIGFSDDVEARIAQIKTGNPFEVKLIAKIPGTLLQEKEAHKALKTAFGRCNIPVPPNEWYPSRSNVIKKFSEMAVLYGINHALASIDSWNPSVNTNEMNLETRSYEPKLQWPQLHNHKKNMLFGIDSPKGFSKKTIENYKKRAKKAARTGIN